MQKTPIIFTKDKIFCHTGRISEFIQHGSCMPICYEIDLTDSCNNKCPKCAGLRAGHQLSRVFAENIIDQIALCGGKSIIFTGGGEPSLHPDLAELVIHAKNSGLDVGVNTNGLAVTPELLGALLRFCTWVRFSLDASDYADYKKTHGLSKAKFDRVLSNIRSAVLIKKNLGLNCTIGVGFLTDKVLVKKMYNATLLARGLGVDYIQFRPFHYDKTSLSPYFAECLILETKSFKVLWSKSKYELMNEKRRPYDECFGQNFSSVVCADGCLYVCCHHRNEPEFRLGDLKTQYLSDIWYGDRRKEVLKNINVHSCVPLCKCDPYNRTLWELKACQEQAHKNFM